MNTSYTKLTTGILRESQLEAPMRVGRVGNASCRMELHKQLVALRHHLSRQAVATQGRCQVRLCLAVPVVKSHKLFCTVHIQIQHLKFHLQKKRMICKPFMLILGVILLWTKSGLVFNHYTSSTVLEINASQHDTLLVSYLRNSSYIWNQDMI